MCTRISDGGNKGIAASFFIDGNVMECSGTATDNPWTAINIRTDNGSPFTEADIRSDELLYDIGINNVPRFDYDNYRVKNLKTAQQAYEDVLAMAGTINRDVVERRIIEETRTGTASYKGVLGTGGIIDSPWNAEGYPEYMAAEAPVDSDNDGMPDDWELANGLNPQDPEDRNRTNGEGYTALEIYLASLMGETIEHGFTTSLHEQYNSGVAVYPRHVTDMLYIKRGDAAIKGIHLLSVSGYLLRTFAANITQIEFSSYPKAHYLLAIEMENGEREVFRVFK